MGGGEINREGGCQRDREEGGRETESAGREERENENSKTLFYKDCREREINRQIGRLTETETETDTDTD